MVKELLADVFDIVEPEYLMIGIFAIGILAVLLIPSRKSLADGASFHGGRRKAILGISVLLILFGVFLLYPLFMEGLEMNYMLLMNGALMVVLGLTLVIEGIRVASVAPQPEGYYAMEAHVHTPGAASGQNGAAQQTVEPSVATRVAPAGSQTATVPTTSPIPATAAASAVATAETIATPLPEKQEIREPEQIQCPKCTTTFTVTETYRPVKIQCPNCGVQGLLRD